MNNVQEHLQDVSTGSTIEPSKNEPMHTVISKNYHLLIVDDQQINIQLLENLLMKNGYAVTLATGGNQALEILRTTKDFDLVLLDVDMPGMNGFEVCRAMRKQKHLKEIPVIFLTALSDTEDIVAGFEAGGQDYVTKPFNAVELLARVQTYLELKKGKDELRKMNKKLEEKVTQRTAALRQANADLEAANRELESLDTAKTEFLRIISHELNTPLNGMMGFINLMKEEVKTDQQYIYLAHIDESARRLLALARVSLQITELRTQNTPLQKAFCPPAEILKTIEADTALEIKAKKINLVVRNGETQPYIFGDPKLISFCFQKIILNAVKHSENNTTLTLHFDSGRENTVCSFVDQGTGFSSYALQNLFKLFSTGREHVDGNEGLDLSLVKIIMDLHNGAIEVKNNENTGATVQLTFPNGPH